MKARFVSILIQSGDGMETKQEKIARLQKKRSDFLALKERDRLRQNFGKEIVGAISEKIGRELSLDDFKLDVNLPFDFKWNNEKHNMEGLVASCINRTAANEILRCIREKISLLSGTAWFQDKPYLGSAKLNEVDPVHLLEIADATNDSIVFFSDDLGGVIMVDCYKSQPDEPYSVVVQGDKFVLAVGNCFFVRKD